MGVLKFIKININRIQQKTILIANFWTKFALFNRGAVELKLSFNHLELFEFLEELAIDFYHFILFVQQIKSTLVQ